MRSREIILLLCFLTFASCEQSTTIESDSKLGDAIVTDNVDLVDALESGVKF